MVAALREAEEAAGAGEIPVGAVVVQGGAVLAAGQNRTIRDHDPSAHAEVAALRAACQAQSNHRLTDAMLYVAQGSSVT